jgi:hypothetical protein
VENNSPRSKKLQIVFRLNMLIGVFVAAIATYFIITGNYTSIQSREVAETAMEWTAVVALLYVAAFWYMCVFREQFFLKLRK